MSINVANLLDEYGEKLDIIYDDGLQPGNNYGYNQLVYWDSYTIPPPKISVLSPEDTTYEINNVTLAFTVNKATTWIGYSLDGQEQTTITENLTLSNLSEGEHNITIYAKDKFENIGASDTITFNIDSPDPDGFPVLLAAALVVFAAASGVGFLICHKKQRHESARERKLAPHSVLPTI